jgi:hypothetical protein
VKLSQRSTLVFVLLSAVHLTACKADKREVGATATFGVVFGGQIQRREEIPFELDATRQTQAFRVTLERPAPSPLRILWELSKPATRSRKPSTRINEATLVAGETQFEHTIAFEPGDPLGVWNLRVVLAQPSGEQHVLVDRPFHVFDRAERRRRLAELGDAGP